jgi:hypothetical protein
MKPTLKYRVYAFSLEPNGERTFYIGKGNETRLGSHMPNARSGHLCPKCAMLRYILKEDLRCYYHILLETNDEDYALWYEMKVITTFPYGALCNLIGSSQPIKVKYTKMPNGCAGEIFKRERDGTSTRLYCRSGASQYECEEQLIDYYDGLILDTYLHRVTVGLDQIHAQLSVRWRITPRRTPGLL